MWFFRYKKLKRQDNNFSWYGPLCTQWARNQGRGSFANLWHSPESADTSQSMVFQNKLLSDWMGWANSPGIQLTHIPCWSWPYGNVYPRHQSPVRGCQPQGIPTHSFSLSEEHFLIWWHTPETSQGACAFPERLDTVSHQQQSGRWTIRWKEYSSESCLPQGAVTACAWRGVLLYSEVWRGGWTVHMPCRTVLPTNVCSFLVAVNALPLSFVPLMIWERTGSSWVMLRVPHSGSKRARGSDGSTHWDGWPRVRRHPCLRLNNLPFCAVFPSRQCPEPGFHGLFILRQIDFTKTQVLLKGSWRARYWASSVTTHTRHRRNAEFMSIWTLHDLKTGLN